jgi:hypothetical protein
MRNLAVLTLVMIALAACDLPDPPKQQSSHAWQEAPIGSRIRSASTTATGDSSSSADTTFLTDSQRSGTLCAGISCGR